MAFAIGNGNNLPRSSRSLVGADGPEGRKSDFKEVRVGKGFAVGDIGLGGVGYDEARLAVGRPVRWRSQAATAEVLGLGYGHVFGNLLGGGSSFVLAIRSSIPDCANARFPPDNMGPGALTRPVQVLGRGSE